LFKSAHNGQILNWDRGWFHSVLS